MVIAKKNATPKKADSKAADKFVSGGLSRSDDAKLHYTTVRFPARVGYLFDQMQECVDARNFGLNTISKNEWMLEAIAEKIKREQSGD